MVFLKVVLLLELFASMVNKHIRTMEPRIIFIGVNKTYRLTFESVPSMHALFIKEKAHNHWSMSSKALREFSEHFGPGTEQLDIYLEGGRLNFTSFTEKVMLGSGSL